MEKTTETNMQIDRVNKQSEGFVDQVFEPTAVPQSLCAPAMILRLTKLYSFQQSLSFQGQKPYWGLGRPLKRMGRKGDGNRVKVCQSEVLEFFYISAPSHKATKVEALSDLAECWQLKRRKYLVILW